MPGGRSGSLSYPEMQREREAKLAFAERYNRVIRASRAFPYPDICPPIGTYRTMAEVRTRLASRPSRNDGSVFAAIRFGSLADLKRHIASGGDVLIARDPDFHLDPTEWAFAMGRIDMVQALRDAGAPDRLALNGFNSPYTYTLLFGRKQAARWVIDHTPTWKQLRGGDHVLWEALEYVDADLAWYLVDHYVSQDPAALPELADQSFLPHESLGQIRPRILADPRWHQLCRSMPEPCKRFARMVSAEANESDLRLFFDKSWTPTPQDVALMISDAARSGKPDRIRLFGRLGYDKQALAGLPLRPHIISSVPACTPTPANMAVVVTATCRNPQDENRIAKATRAALIEIGMSPQAIDGKQPPQR